MTFLVGICTYLHRILEANLLLILIIPKTFECLWLHTLHAKPQENEFESFSGQCLSEYIRQLILYTHEIQLKHSLFHLFSDEMMSDVDVFRPGVLDVVAAESYGTLVVTIQRDVIVRILQKSQENGQNRTNTDTGMEKSAQEPGEFYQRAKIKTRRAGQET
ncbi:hypothetical protein Tco_0608981 [Tanacetum coccineum]